MLSFGYFDYRWSWYSPIINRGEVPANRGKVDVRRLPVRIPGEDAREYIPYALHSDLAAVFSGAVQRLQDYAFRYMVKGEKVSGHQLPQMDAVSREIAIHLRKRYPHLPHSLIHHWCGDERGAPALYNAWQNMWRQSWKQDQADIAPWVPAVNVLILKLVREAISHLSDEHPATTDHVMICMVGGLYDWAVQRFLKDELSGAVEVTRISTYESMIIPATPIAFLYRQTDKSLLADDRYVISAYGLEADLVPRMRILRAKVGSKNEAGILALLARERMGEHFLRRSWARLSLWELAEQTNQAIWMQWVLDAKKLDQLLAKPEEMTDNLARTLEPNRKKFPIAEWLMKRREGVKAEKCGAPWLQDDRVLMAFRVFEEDVKVEVERRRFEELWLDQRPILSGRGQGHEANKTLDSAYKEGKLIYFQPDADKSLHSGVTLASKQGCLRVEWSDYLAAASALHDDYGVFLEKVFLPGVMALVVGRDKLFVDSCSASGCMLRGSVEELVTAATELRSRMRDWFKEISDTDEAFNMPAVSMCIALMGEWVFVRHENKGSEDVRIAFSLAVAQADSGVSRDCGVGRLIAYRDHHSGKKPLGGVRVERVESGSGQSVQVLYNNGIALTGLAVGELTGTMRHRASVREYRVDPKAFAEVLAEYRHAGEGMELIAIVSKGEESNPLLLVKAGKPCLAGVDIDLYELLDKDTRPARLIYTEGLSRWR